MWILVVVVDPFPLACTDQQPDDPPLKMEVLKQRGHLHAHNHTFGSGASCGIIKHVVVSTTPTQCQVTDWPVNIHYSLLNVCYQKEVLP